MAIVLSKGEKIDLTKTNPRTKKSNCWSWLGYE